MATIEQDHEVGYLFDEAGEHMGYFVNNRVPRRMFIKKIRNMERILDVPKEDRVNMEGLKVDYMSFNNVSLGQNMEYTVVVWKTEHGIL